MSLTSTSEVFYGHHESGYSFVSIDTMLGHEALVAALKRRPRKPKGADDEGFGLLVAHAPSEIIDSTSQFHTFRWACHVVYPGANNIEQETIDGRLVVPN